MWVGQGSTNHAITMFAHDQETVDTWFWLGFGLWSMDAIRKSGPVEDGNSSIEVRKVDAGDVPGLRAMHREHNLYYRNSPVFMPRPDEDPVEDLTSWLLGPGHHTWTTCALGKPTGYMRIQPGGETFVSEHPAVMNVTYVLEDARRSGAGTLLLEPSRNGCWRTGTAA